MPNVFAALFFPPTLDQMGTKNAQQKMTEMKTAIERAQGLLATYAATMKANDPLLIFAAPEYYFVKTKTVNGQNQTWTLYTEDEKKAIVEELRTLSARWKKFLIVPGSIAWFKPKNTPVGARTKDGWNSTPLLYQGNVVHEYDKIFNDGGYGQFTTDVQFQKGTKSQLFKVDNLKFGIEVCGDLNDGNLSKEAAAASLDFEIMISATNRHEFDDSGINKVPVRDGGYFIHTDSDKADYCNVWCLRRGAGSHGTVVPNSVQGALLFDPFNGNRLSGDIIGVNLAAGTVLAMKMVANYKSGNMPQAPGNAPGGVRLPQITAPALPPLPGKVNLPPLPGKPAVPAAPTPATFQMVLDIKPVTPYLGSVAAPNRYTVEMSITMTSAAAVSNKPITFTATNGTVANGNQMTDMTGKAKALFTGQKGTPPMLMNASFNGVTVTAEASLVMMGGNVTRMARLLPETEPQMRSFYMPT